MANSSRNLWACRKKTEDKFFQELSEQNKKKVIWPNLFVLADKAVYIVKNKEINKILENEEDGKYYSASWSNADLFVSTDVFIYKFYKKFEDPYKRTYGGIRSLYVEGPLIYALTSEGITTEYTIALEMNRLKSKIEIPSKEIIKNNDFVVKLNKSMILLLDNKNLQLIDQININDNINEICILDKGFTHNGVEFPIKI